MRRALSGIAIAISAIGGAGLAFSKPADRSVEDVARLLRDCAEGRLSGEEWDAFLRRPIPDRHLNALRLEALALGNNPDKAALLALAAKVDDLGEKD